jgi:alkylation response protein AidB-like acyl-CoA dehydrogenase
VIYSDLPNLRDVLPGIRSRADRYDIAGDFPAEDLRVLASIGAMRWSIPMSLGGEELSSIELHYRYEAIASASLATALVLSQRDSAIGLIDGGTNAKLRDQLLPQLARDEIFATVGIAQLTTSRQRGAPALIAERHDGRLRLRGTIPWSSGADQAAYVVAGAVVPDEGQILVALPTDLPGVSVQPPMKLVSLGATHTSSITCDEAMLDQQLLLAGPVESVLSGRRNVLPIGQAFLALGLTCGAINLIAEHDSPRGRELRARFEQQFNDLRSEVLDHCNPSLAPDPLTSARLRGVCNELALRATHAAVALYKGTALLADHPAQRLAREAMFLLVWSCPDPVIDCTVNLLSASPER